MVGVDIVQAIVRVGWTSYHSSYNRLPGQTVGAAINSVSRVELMESHVVKESKAV